MDPENKLALIIRQNKEYGKLLGSLIQQIEELTKAQREIVERLDGVLGHQRAPASHPRQSAQDSFPADVKILQDQLTGLPNRRAFLRRLEDEVGRVQRYNLPLSLAFIEPNRPGEVNDKDDPGEEDELLRSFSSHVLSNFRHHDMVARYDDDVFVVLLPNINMEGALYALRNMKGRVVQENRKTDESIRNQLTFSAGLALYKPGESPGAFIERATGAMHKAKSRGGNRVEVSE